MLLNSSIDEIENLIGLKWLRGLNKRMHVPVFYHTYHGRRSKGKFVTDCATLKLSAVAKISSGFFAYNFQNSGD